MGERHYSDEEAAAIFERAAETEHGALPAPSEGKGLTLAGAGFMALAGAGLFAAGALRVSGWARRRKGQIEAIIARLALSARTLPGAANPTGDES